jgi:hypothetical protein
MDLRVQSMQIEWKSHHLLLVLGIEIVDIDRSFGDCRGPPLGLVKFCNRLWRIGMIASGTDIVADGFLMENILEIVGRELHYRLG